MRPVLILLLALFLASLARAQESVVTGISTESIALTANYDGSEIFVFGAVRRDAPIPEDMPPLGIVITLKGPERLVTVRRKDRRLGIWLNTETVRIRDAPSFYAIASTGPIDELLTEIEGIVNSGTKLDISYYLRDFMDEDKIEDIYLYFKEDAESDSLDAAIDELGADYTEEEIRLVQIGRASCRERVSSPV